MPCMTPPLPLQVDFCVLTANLLTVASQTSKRIELSGLCSLEDDEDRAVSQRVLRYSAAKEVEDAFKLLQRRVCDCPRTLFVIVADEAHWGALKGKPHDTYVNDLDLIKKKNVVIMPVSATLYCLHTLDSRIPARYQPRDGAYSVLMHIDPENGQATYFTEGPDGIVPSDAPSDLNMLTEVNTVSWREVVRDDGRRFVADEDIAWLQGQLQKNDAWRQLVKGAPVDGPKYRSLAMFLDPAKELIRADVPAKPLKPTTASSSLPFEALAQAVQLYARKSVSAADLLAVDYAFHLLFLGGTHDDGTFVASFDSHASWLVDKNPYGFKSAVKAYLVAHAAVKLKEPVLKLLNELLRHQYAGPFAQPVDPLIYPSYYEGPRVVADPIDLGSIKKNLEAGAYADADAVKTDVDRVWANCRQYNGEERRLRGWPRRSRGSLTRR